MKKKYQIYKELSKLFNEEQNQARINFWARCKEHGIKGFAIWMCILPVLIVYGIYFGCIYGPYLVESWKNKRAAKQALDTCTPEEEVNWDDDEGDFVE